MTSKVVHWHHDVDVDSAQQLRAEIDRALAAPVPETIVVDLRGVEFVDSSGIGMLVQTRAVCRGRQVQFRLRGVSAAVTRVLTLTGLERFFDLDDPLLEPVTTARLPSAVPLPGTPDAKFDRIAALAARLLDVPVALVTFVDRERQVVPGAAGPGAAQLTAREAPLAESYCQFVVHQATALIVDDVSREPLLAGVNEAATLDVTAYAGIPVTGRDGRAVGALCAIDTEVHAWSTAEVQIMQDLAAACSAELQLRTASRHVDRLNQQLRGAQNAQRELSRDIAALTQLLQHARASSEEPTTHYLERSLDAVRAIADKTRAPAPRGGKHDTGPAATPVR